MWLLDQGGYGGCGRKRVCPLVVFDGLDAGVEKKKEERSQR